MEANPIMELTPFLFPNCTLIACLTRGAIDWQQGFNKKSPRFL